MICVVAEAVAITQTILVPSGVMRVLKLASELAGARSKGTSPRNALCRCTIPVQAAGASQDALMNSGIDSDWPD